MSVDGQRFYLKYYLCILLVNVPPSYRMDQECLLVGAII